MRGKERCMKLCSAGIVSATHFLCDVAVLGAQSQCPLETPVAHTTHSTYHTQHISHTAHLTYSTSHSPHITTLWSYLRVGVTCFCSKASTPPRTSLWKAERERERLITVRGSRATAGQLTLSSFFMMLRARARASPAHVSTRSEQ